MTPLDWRRLLEDAALVVPVMVLACALVGALMFTLLGPGGKR